MRGRDGKPNICDHARELKHALVRSSYQSDACSHVLVVAAEVIVRS